MFLSYGGMGGHMPDFSIYSCWARCPWGRFCGWRDVLWKGFNPGWQSYLLAFLFQVRMSCNLRFGVSMLVPLQGAPVGCFRVLLLEWCVHWPFRLVSALWRWLAGVAAGCCFRVLLLDWCVRVCFGAGVLVPLQGATSVVRMLCPLWSWRVSCRVARGCCRSQWCVRFGAGLLVCRVPLQGAASGCCQSDVCALELACWCSQSNVCVLELALLQDAASRCCC